MKRDINWYFQQVKQKNRGRWAKKSSQRGLFHQITARNILEAKKRMPKRPLEEHHRLPQIREPLDFMDAGRFPAKYQYKTKITNLHKSRDFGFSPTTTGTKRQKQSRAKKVKPRRKASATAPPSPRREGRKFKRPEARFPTKWKPAPKAQKPSKQQKQGKAKVRSSRQAKLLENKFRWWRKASNGGWTLTPYALGRLAQRKGNEGRHPRQPSKGDVKRWTSIQRKRQDEIRSANKAVPMAM